MKSLIAASVAAAAMAAAVPAAAQVTYYGNLGYSFIQAEDLDVNLGAIGGKVGARFNPYLGAEAEAAFGVDDDSARVLNVPVKVELKHAVAAYVVGFVPVSENLELFGRLGYGSAKVKASALGASASDDGAAWNLGAGAQYFFTANDGVRGEYLKSGVSGDDGLEADVWSLSYVRRF